MLNTEADYPNINVWLLGNLQNVIKAINVGHNLKPKKIKLSPNIIYIALFLAPAEG